MAQFDVYANPIAEQRKRVPFWVDIQSDFLRHLETRVILPLPRVGDPALLIEGLNPTFKVNGISVYADTGNMAAFPQRLLKRPAATLKNESHGLISALDFLISGV